MVKHIISEDEFKALKEEEYKILVTGQSNLEDYSKEIFLFVSARDKWYEVIVNKEMKLITSYLVDAVDEYNKH